MIAGDKNGRQSAMDQVMSEETRDSWHMIKEEGQYTQTGKVERRREGYCGNLRASENTTFSCKASIVKLRLLMARGTYLHLSWS